MTDVSDVHTPPAFSDQDLFRLLGEAADSFDTQQMPDLGDAVRAPLPDRARPQDYPWFRLAVAASLVTGMAAFALSSGGTRVSEDEIAQGAVSQSATATATDPQVEIAQGARSAAGAVSSGSTGSADASTSGVLNEIPDLSLPAPADAGTSTTGSSTALGSVDAGAFNANSGSAGGTTSGGSTGSVATPTAGQSVDQGRIIKTGEIALNVDNGRVSPTLTAVQQAATSRGGVVFSTATNEAGDEPNGVVTLRVPVERFEELVVAIRNLVGVEVRAATTRGQDITGQFADTETQIRTLTATRERYLVILGEARNVGEILSVQQRVDQVSLQIDRLQGELNVLASRSDMSTVTVSVRETEDVEAAELVPLAAEESSGLSAAWNDAKDGFSDGVEGLIARSGTAAVLLLCGAVLLVAGRFGYRLFRRRMV